MDSSRNQQEFQNQISNWLKAEKEKWRDKEMVEMNHVGQSFDEFLQEEGIYEKVQLNALKKTLAHQIKTMMEEQGIRKAEMATRMKTSRSSLERLLNEEAYNVTIATISKAATVLGKRIELSLVEKNMS